MNSSNTASSSSLSGDKTIISNGKTSPTLLNGTVNEGFQGDSNSSNVYPIVDDEIAVDTFDDGFYELYESESPDELALVRAASTYGCRLHRRTIKTVDVILPGMSMHNAAFDKYKVTTYFSTCFLRPPVSKIVRAFLSILSQ